MMLTLIRKPIGRVVHAYRQGEMVGPYRGAALCGTRPSLGWGRWDELDENVRRPPRITCLRCVEKLTDDEKKQLAERPGAEPWKPERDPLDEGDNLGESPDY